MNYEQCLEQVETLEIIKNLHGEDKEVITKNIADFIYRSYQRKKIDAEYLNKIAESLLSVSRGDEEEPEYNLNSNLLLKCEVLKEELLPWAKRLRRRYFRSAKAPFSNYEAAVQWVIKTYYPNEPPIIGPRYTRYIVPQSERSTN